MDVQWATFWALVATFLVVVWQAKATADAAKASRDSIKTTEKHFALLNAQWLDISEFYCRAIEVPESLKAAATGKLTPMWAISLKISNNTPLQVGIQEIECYLGGKFSTFPARKTIGPRNHWTYDLGMMLMDEELMATLKAGQQVGVLLVGRVYYRTALGQTTHQPFAKTGTILNFAPTRLTEEIPGDLDHIFDSLRKNEAHAKKKAEQGQ